MILFLFKNVKIITMKKRVFLAILQNVLNGHKRDEYDGYRNKTEKYIFSKY